MSSGVGTPRQLSPEERQAYTIGCRSFERGNADEALLQFTRLLRTRQDFADVHYRVGVLLDGRNELAASARSLSRALRINPHYMEAMLALASVYERQGDFERSREIAERARSIAARGDGPLDATTRGKLANLQAALGNAFHEVGELREAIEAYRKALDRCPDFHDIRHRLAIALRDAGLPDRALAELRRIMRANPGFLDARVQLGLTLYTLGRTDEALQEWRAVLEQEPAQREARMYLRLVQPDPRGHSTGGE